VQTARAASPAFGIKPVYRPRNQDPLRRLLRRRFPAFQTINIAYQSIIIVWSDLHIAGVKA
jgi:hypothetical protein